MTTFNFPLLGYIDIDFNCKELLDFTVRQLNNYVVNVVDSNIIKNCQIIIRNNELTENFRKFSSSNIMLGRQYYVKNNIFYMPNFEYSLNNSELKIVCKISSPKRKWYKKCKKMNYSQCHINFYNQILFPIFSLYTMLDRYYLIHGSLLNINNKNVIICGLDGVGKSSLSNLLQKNGAKIYADNFVLFNGVSAVPLNMTMRLAPNQDTNLKVLYKDKDLKEVLPENKEINPVKVDKILLLSVSDKSILQKLKLNMINMSLFLNLASEINSANLFIAPFLFESIKQCNKYIDEFTNISIPMGKLDNYIGEVLNEC